MKKCDRCGEDEIVKLYRTAWQLCEECIRICGWWDEYETEMLEMCQYVEVASGTRHEREDAGRGSLTGRPVAPKPASAPRGRYRQPKGRSGIRP
jgi:hypothetical protein